MCKVLRICGVIIATVAIMIVLFMAMLNALDKELEIQRFGLRRTEPGWPSIVRRIEMNAIEIIEKWNEYCDINS